MIDLSFLTEAEQEAILKVLNRDAELKKAEDERVKHLHDVIDDENEFKYKSGQWFYDAKSKRHRDKIHGAELVRASIRKRKKPTTIAELSELNKDSSKRRWVNSVNQDIFIPPELYGVMEPPDEVEEDIMLKKAEGNQSSKTVSFSSPPEKEQDKLRNGVVFLPKPRLNPFNSSGLPDELDSNNQGPGPDPKSVQMNGTLRPKPGEEPLYAVVNKTPAASSPSLEQDFDLDDTLMEPRFHGQRGKTQNIYQYEKPLEFGKSFSGGGKITLDSSYPSKKTEESYSYSSEEMTPERAVKSETSYSNVEDKPIAITQDSDDPIESVAPWRRHFKLENQEPRRPSPGLSEEQKTSIHILQESPRVNVKAEDTFGKTYTGNRSKTFPGVYNKDTKYKSVFQQNKFDAEPKPVGLIDNVPVIQDGSESSSNTDGELGKSLQRANNGKDLPRMAHFNVMSLKERLNEMPREQMSNPSQFQSLKHFWNVEEKNQLRETTVTSPDKIVTNVSSRNMPTRTDLKQRSSEIPADEVMLPNTLDSLSEEEKTSQKVASWLAQTPTVYGVSQMDQNEDRLDSGEDIVEHVQKSKLPKKSEVFANSLQKLKEEDLEVPKKTETERFRTEKIQMVPQKKPELADHKQTTTERGFYEQAIQINKPFPAKETLSVEQRNKPYEESVDKTVAPEKSSSEFRIGFEKPNFGISGKEVQKESSVPSEESETEAEELVETSLAPKSQDQQDFISALKKLEIEASKPPPLSHVDVEYQDELPEEEISQNTVSLVKSSFLKPFTSDNDTDEFEAPTDNTVEFQSQHNYVPDKEPVTEHTSHLEETIEKSKVPSRNDNEDLSVALRKLELEAIEHQSEEEYVVGVDQELAFEKPESQLAWQTNLSEDQPDQNVYSSMHGKPLVVEEPIENTRVESQESSADFHNRLLLLEEQAKIPEEPEDLSDGTVKISQFLNSEEAISKKAYSSDESMPKSVENSSDCGKAKEVDFPTSKPEDFNDLKSHESSYSEELANYPHVPEPTGSYTGNRKMLYEKPEVGSPEVANSKPGMDPSHPIMRALKRSEAKMLNSKALQEVSPTSTNPLNSSIPTEDTPAPAVNSFPENAETLKRLSQSVPTMLQDETDGRDTDSASESSFQIGRHKKSPSSLTNLSGSSGMASMSSVSGSVMSIYSGDFGNVDIKGGIEFSIDYVEQLKEFLIYVYQCRDLAVAEVKKQRSDPYVKAYLLPEKAKMGKRKTAVKKKTLNPVYNEILRYKIPKQSLTAQTLNLSVWHHDALGRNSFLGEVNTNLGTWDWSNTQRKWYPLEPRTPAAGIGLENRGEVKLSLKYIPGSLSGSGTKPTGTGEVCIWIKECVQLPMLRDKINSFVKCTVLPDTSRKSRQKTRTVDKTPNPIFNHTMVYDGFKEEDLREACVELTVWDHNRLSNHFLGGLRIGLGTGKSYGTAVDWMDSTPEESAVWEKMMAAPNAWVDGMLPLRMFKMAKMAK